MLALLTLLPVGGSLLAVGLLGRSLPRPASIVQTLLCLAGLGAALLGREVATYELGATLALDGLSAALLAGLMVLGACRACGPAMLGTITLALLAGDAVSCVACTALALFVTPRASTGVRWWPLGALACAFALLAWHGGGLPDPRYAAIRALPPGMLSGAGAVVLTLVAAAGLVVALPSGPGALLAAGLVARLLLDLPGPVTPGWWGMPVMAAGLCGAALLARRAAAAEDLVAGVDTIARAVIVLSGVGFGVALLSRGADLAPLGALAVVGSLGLVVATALAGGLAGLAAASVERATGARGLGRLGGLLRVMPVTGIGLLVGLVSLAAVPFTPGFAAGWLLIQALLGLARLGGVGTLALAAGGLAGVGLVGALLAAAAWRFAGAGLLGAPRAARTAAAAEPALAVRLGMGLLAAALLAIGVVPALLVALAQPAARQIGGGALDHVSVWSVAIGPDAPGLAVPGVAALLVVCLALAGWAGRAGAGPAAAPWRGGLGEDGPARPNTHPLRLVPDWRARWPEVLHRVAPWHGVAALLLVLAVALGWAAR